MNERDKLLAAALDDGSGAEFARRAAAHARRRRLAPQLLLAGATAMAICAAVLLSPPPANTPPDARRPAAGTVDASYEAMSDRELLEKLGDRPVLVLREQGGISGVVFLPSAGKSGL